MYTQVKTDQEITAMRKAGAICSDVLYMLKNTVKPGMTTQELADLAGKEITAAGGQAAFFGYSGFPDVICISLNEEIVHGIPSTNRTVKKGDVISFDLGVSYEGMIVDSAISVLVDSDDKTRQRLLSATRASLNSGLKRLHDGCATGDIGYAIENKLKQAKLGIIRELVGHGVGHQVHEDPNIPNYGRENSGPKLKTGMTVAIEPMATLGGEKIYVDEDGWTVKTADGSLSAHFEQTVLITQKGYEILTPFK